jgi:hypothetical protein
MKMTLNAVSFSLLASENFTAIYCNENMYNLRIIFLFQSKGKLVTVHATKAYGREVAQRILIIGIR